MICRVLIHKQSYIVDDLAVIAEWQTGGVELMYVFNGSCWGYLFCVSRGFLKVCQPPSGSNELGSARGPLPKKKKNAGFWFWNTPYQAHTRIHADTRDPVALSDHTASFYFCVAVSKRVFMLGLVPWWMPTQCVQSQSVRVICSWSKKHQPWRSNKKRQVRRHGCEDKRNGEMKICEQR